MSRRLAVPLILISALLFATFGLARLRFDTDILSMLPPGLPEVKGLKAFHEGFSRKDELVIVIQGGEDDAGLLGEAAASLGENLAAAGLVERPRWEPRWNTEPEGIAELLAYLWLNGEPAAAAEKAAELSPARSRETLAAALEKVATSMEGMDMVMLANDPLGFLDHPSVAVLMDSAGPGGEGYESEDGLTRLLFADAPPAIGRGGYREAHAWLTDVRAAISKWQASDGAGLTVRLTGEPVFSSEIGVAMENDLSGSIGITLGLIGLLFWWMQRRFSLLLGLTGVLVLVFAVALGAAGWLYGELSIIALSSIEILIGLAVDYGLVICQEAKVNGHNRQALRAAVTRPVFFGAVTTAVVFSALNLGGLPGMAQLGSIVGIGLVAAAVLMLLVYLPFVIKFGVNREPAHGSGKMLPRGKKAWAVTGGLLAAAAAVLAVNGLPEAEFSSKIMRPRTSEAMETFEHIQNVFPAWSADSLGLVIEADDDAEMKNRLLEARQRIDIASADGLLGTATLPEGCWTDPEPQIANQMVLAGIYVDRERLLTEADAAGFSEEGLALARGVLDALDGQTMAEVPVFPRSEAALEVARLFLTRDEDGGGHVLGSVRPAEGIEPAGKDWEAFRTLAGDGIWLSGWELFKPAIANLVRVDMTRMLVPMFILLIGMMAFIFRRAADVVLALFAMVVSTALLLAVMSVTGMKWNFINLMATPLLLGAGIDYAIHVTLSLRRTGGDFRELWQGTGKALMFCGAANAIGFGSLLFSSSDALVSLGAVAVIGILLSMAVSVFLLPGWRRRDG